MRRSLRTLDALERSASEQHLHMLTLFTSAAPLSDASLLAQLRLERAHMAKLVANARVAKRSFQRLEKQVRARVRARSRALWRLVAAHVVLHSVAWWWFQLPSRSTRFELERCKAIEEYERECATRIVTGPQTVEKILSPLSLGGEGVAHGAHNLRRLHLVFRTHRSLQCASGDKWVALI